MTNTPNDIIVAHDVARLLGIKEAAVYRLARSGHLPCWRLGRVLRFSRTAIESFRAAGGTAARAA